MFIVLWQLTHSSDYHPRVWRARRLANSLSNSACGFNPAGNNFLFELLSPSGTEEKEFIPYAVIRQLDISVDLCYFPFLTLTTPLVLEP